jgi:signal transduction histidine kinase
MRDFISRNPAAGLKFMMAMAGIIRGQMKETTDTLTYFLSIISHELKAPLAAIENYLEILLGGFAGELSGKQQRILERSTLRARDLRSLINNILDLARMQPENIQADFAWFDPLEVSTEAIENVLSAAKEKGVTLKVDAAADFEKIVGARRRLLQVLSNLLSNAIKFSPEDSEVTLRLRDEPQELVIEVLDEGIGISADEQTHIFEDFFRGQNIGEATGTGLGLSITKMIVNAHQGKIEVESPYQEGKSGAKFTVVIPRDLATPDMRRREWKSARSKSES